MADHAHASDRHYVQIWGVLCVLLVISIAGPFLGIRLVTLITAFGIAVVKAYMVAKNFMHLNIERRWIVYILLVMIAFLVVMVGGFAPDILKHEGQRWHKTYQEPVAIPGAEHHE